MIPNNRYTLGTPNCVSSLEAGTTKTLTANITSAGTSPYTYEFKVTRPDSVVETFSGSSSTHDYTFTQTGNYTVRATVTDSCASGATSDYSECTINVTPACSTITCSITSCPPSTVIQGAQTSLVVSWSGGTPNYTVQLYIDDNPYGSASSVSGTSATISFTVDNTWLIGTHTAKVYLRDSCTTQQTCMSAWCSFQVVSSCQNVVVQLQIA